MDDSWLLVWDSNQENPTIEFIMSPDTNSFAFFPDVKQSFVFIEGFLLNRDNFRGDHHNHDCGNTIHS